VHLIGCSKAQIDDLNIVLEAPVDGAKDNGEICGQLPIEYLDRNDLGLGSEMVNDCSDSSAMAEAVKRVFELAISRDLNTFDEPSYVRVRGLNSTVENSDAD
jgi:hypothetical protein